MLARMPLFVNRISGAVRTIGLSLGVLALGPGWASADPDASLERWAPAFAIQGGVLSQTATGTLSASEVLGACWLGAGDRQNCECNPSDNQFLTRQEGTPTSSSRIMTPYFSFAAELMSPALFTDWGSPRALVHVDAGYSFGFDRGITRVGSPLEELFGRFSSSNSSSCLRRPGSSGPSSSLYLDGRYREQAGWGRDASISSPTP